MVADEQNNVLLEDLGYLVGPPRTCVLDSKRRFTVYSGWRKILTVADCLYVMPDLELPCLNLLSPSAMGKRLAALRERKLSEKGIGNALRNVGENSELLKLDVQGRARVCDRLLRAAHIDDKVVLVPAVVHIQLWAPSLYPGGEDVNRETWAETGTLLDI